MDQASQKLQYEPEQVLRLAEDVTDPLATALVSDVIEHLQGRLAQVGHEAWADHFGRPAFGGIEPQLPERQEDAWGS